MTNILIFRTARAADLPAIRELVTTEFCHNEAPTKHLRNTKSGFAKLYDRFAAHLELETTIVAEEIQRLGGVDKQQKGKIVSCHVSIPLAANLDLDGITEQLPILRLLEEVSVPFGEVLKKRSIPESRVLHSLLGATRQEYHGKGLYQQVIGALTQEILKSSRWDMAVSECTSPTTRYIKKRKFGWTEENFIAYENFEQDGRKPFAGLDGGVALLWKDYRDMKGKV
ncbi:hypothetical protein CVT24_009214 [Panaeolus cyanescens]|uniref:N-acetyltransferase domain-containing protein n=1 Tax=Panaeolus cyanescens TaxID=181874 RepID=A0A409Y8F9_9AGAR|nr:hypothetical protein CVT24_009214 [Panaeolus cyanescens]